MLPSYPAHSAGDALGEALVLEDGSTAHAVGVCAGRLPRPEGVPPLAGRPLWTGAESRMIACPESEMHACPAATALTKSLAAPSAARFRG